MTLNHINIFKTSVYNTHNTPNTSNSMSENLFISKRDDCIAHATCEYDSYKYKSCNMSEKYTGERITNINDAVIEGCKDFWTKKTGKSSRYVRQTEA